MPCDIVHAYRGSALSSVPAAIVVLPHMSLARVVHGCTRTAAWTSDDELGQCEQEPREHPAGHSRAQPWLSTDESQLSSAKGAGASQISEQQQRWSWWTKRKSTNCWWHARKVAWRARHFRNRKVRWVRKDYMENYDTTSKRYFLMEFSPIKWFENGSGTNSIFGQTQKVWASLGC